MALQVLNTKFGETEIVQIVELEIGEVVQEIIGDATPENLKKITWLTEPYVSSEGTINAIVQCFIIKTGSRIFVVDTCIGNDKDRTDVPEWSNLRTEFIQTLEECKIDTDDVTDVLCTHLHMDHVGWNTYLSDGKWLPTFPNAKYHFAEEEYKYWQSKPKAEIRDDHASFDDSVVPIVEAGLANFIDVNTDLGDGISTISTPGHTPSHVSVIIDTNTHQIVISGDALHHPCQVARPNWSTDADFDKNQASLTRTKLLDSISSNSSLLAGSHFSLPSIGSVKLTSSGEYIFIPKQD